MNEDLKKIFYTGLGVLSEASDKMKETGENFYNKGKELYEKGIIANEELKHKINEVIKDNVTIVEINNGNTKDDILRDISKLSEDEQKELRNILNKKEWADINNDEKERSQ